MAQVPDPGSSTAGPLPASVWKICAVAALGSLLSQLDATIVNVSLSSLATELHSSLTTIQWVTTGYLLALALVLPLNGWLVDRIGARAVYLWCFSAFTFASATCGFAWSANSLVAFRVLQGMAGGLLAPMAQMMMARAAGKQMARVAGYMSLPILLGPILGPVIAGAILQYGSWRWLFFVNVPIGALAVFLANRCLPDDRTETNVRRLDLIGLALLSPTIVLFLYGSDHLESYTGRSSLAAATVLLVCFLWHGTRRGRQALIDLQLFRRKTFTVSAIAQFLFNGISFAGQMLIPFFLIRACGQSPGSTGLLMMPLGLGMACAFPLMGALTHRLGLRKVAAGGAFLSLLGTLSFLYLAGHGLVLAMLVAALFLRGAGLGAVGIPSMTAAYVSVRREDLPTATTSLNIVQRLGGPILTTACATFLAWRMSAANGSANLHGPFVAAFGLLCVLQALLFFCALWLPVSVDRAAMQRPDGE